MFAPYARHKRGEHKVRPYGLFDTIDQLQGSSDVFRKSLNKDIETFRNHFNDLLVSTRDNLRESVDDSLGKMDNEIEKRTDRNNNG